MTDTQPTLNGLAAKISELSESLTGFLRDNDVPQPTFAADSPTSYSKLTPEAFSLKQQLADAIMDLWYLSQGPSESIFNYVHTSMPDAAALNILNYFDFWSAVPLDGSASHADIAAHVSLPREVVQRVLEHATTLRLFAYADSGSAPAGSRVQHTSRSAALAKSPGLRALVSTIMDDAGPPMMLMNEALARYARGADELSADVGKTAFALLHSAGTFGGPYKNSWELLENDGEGERKGWRQRNFVEFMRYIKDIFQLESVVLNALDWKAAGKATVVDVGGSGGHDDIVLAQKYPDLTITVQDLPKVESEFDAAVPADLKPRLRFMPHDFFQPQPLPADIYLIKLILHDWPDRESVQILRGLVPALRPGARVLFIDYVGKQDAEADADAGGPPVPRSIQQMGTATDMRMMALFSARERPVDAWARLFREADERFDVVRVDANPLTFIVVLEAVWRG